MASGTAALQDTREKVSSGESVLLLNERKLLLKWHAKSVHSLKNKQKGDTSLDEAGIEKGYFFKRH